jgi:hypothetical protein
MQQPRVIKEMKDFRVLRELINNRWVFKWKNILILYYRNLHKVVKYSNSNNHNYNSNNNNKVILIIMVLWILVDSNNNINNNSRANSIHWAIHQILSLGHLEAIMI